MHYLKFKNKRRKVNAEFVVAASGANHLFEDKNIEYLGHCDEAGNITLPAEQDEAFKNKTLEQQLAEVKKHTQKKTAGTVLRRGPSKYMNDDHFDKDEPEFSDQPDGEE